MALVKGMFFLSESTVSGTGTYTVSHSISSANDYQSFRIIFSTRTNSSNIASGRGMGYDRLYMQFNGDTTGANYMFGGVDGNHDNDSTGSWRQRDGSSQGSGNATAYGYDISELAAHNSTRDGSNDVWTSGQIDILHKSGSWCQSIIQTWQPKGNGGSGFNAQHYSTGHVLAGLVWKNTSTLTSVAFKTRYNRFEPGSHFALFGLKNTA
jgi:hypothetical protein